jgi:hypothetical protein
MDPDTAVAVLGVSKIALGWPLQLAALGAMVWVLARNHTPMISPTTGPQTGPTTGPSAQDTA